ncbi:ureidoglycolate lyase [Nitrincola alkalilacustris]|uniref:ureidoglycolate lyase n=1 Tax=Nitrincola alkalilacustris TaxID=1571224 RepID=UPI00124DCF68|nr:ureidoglycolate lyase [Nitrincola alkalilacustris]
MNLLLKPEPLTPAAFAEFGDVIDTDDREFFMINNGSTRRYHRLAEVETGPSDGQAIISIFRAQGLEMPLRIRMLERHPHGSQAFIPLLGRPFLVVVAPKGDEINPADIRAFITHGRQGVNYRSGVWHHPVIALFPEDDFLIVDRTGDLPNCDEHFFPDDTLITLEPNR